jgi:phosphoadenosine phosphosulfate reductase
MRTDRVARLRELARRGAAELADASAVDVLSWADRELDHRLVVASSMQDSLVIDLACQVRPGIDVVFLDTGYHFSETLTMRDAVAATYPIRLLNVEPSHSVQEQDADHGPRLHDRDPDLCCFLRKVKPLNAVLGLYDGWVTGLRRQDGESRRGTEPIEWDERRQMLKVNPIFDWSDADVADYTRDRGVMVNLLSNDGYESIGCAPCTVRTSGAADARSGRWAGSGKSECGIHL